MSYALTLQAALTGYLSGGADSGRRIAVSIPSGTVLTLSDSADQDQVAEQLAAISPTALAQNRTQLDRTIQWPANTPPYTAGNDVLVTYGAHGERIYHDFAASSSVSSSTSSSASSSVSSSASAS